MNGPCAKRRVICTITTTDGRAFVGENDCTNPQPVCPRGPRDDYTKCGSICGQTGHAEIKALAMAHAAGADTRGSHAVVRGHVYICKHCLNQLSAAGVERYTIDRS